MSVRVVDRVDGWDQRPFSGGFDALHDLADEEFSGVVRAGGAELYMTVGTVVAVRRGDIQEFGDTSGTVFSAPAPALPLLAVMQEEDVDVRAQYYSEDTPMSEVDGTLSNGGFTGYVELSENVLSGDYFLVYHGGNSMSVAFVGNNQKLITGDEAFQTADDEVGIYKVRQVDVEPVEIPEPASAGGSTDTAEATAAAASAEGGGTAEESDAPDPDESPPERTETASESPAESDAGRARDQDGESAEAGAASDDRQDRADSAGAAASETTAANGSTAGADSEAARAETETARAGSDESRTGTETARAGSDESRTDTETARNDSPTARSETEGTREERETGRSETAATDERSRTTRSEAAGAERDAAETADRAGRSSDAADDRPGTGAESTETAARTAKGTQPSPERDPGGQSGGRSAQTDSGARSQTGAEANGPTSGRGDAGSNGGSAGGRAAASQSTDRRGGSGGTTQRQAGDLETRSIPSLDPSHTESPTPTKRPEPTPEPTPEPAADPAPEPQRREPETPSQRPETGGAADATPESGQGHANDEATQRDAGTAEPADEPAGAPAEALEELEAELADREAQLERLEADLAEAESDREDLEAELATVREERDDLAADVERLEEELERLEQEFGAATDAETRMTPSEAIEATNLFVEYDSKGKATLEDAQGGSEGREAVAENLRLGVHTEFDDRAVAVGGEDFDEFLRGTLHYRFAEWVVGDLLFEIRDTGHADALPDLYEAIGEIRRVEFNGVVDVEYAEDGQDKSGRERFDVIFRHRMGDPLLVANLNDSREPATGNMMTSLVTSAERVGQTEDALASAFLVTSSFFESEALETVSEATQGGLLSRDSRKSFVNLSRKAGYHLCLVAARDGNFHMEVPEL